MDALVCQPALVAIETDISSFSLFRQCDYVLIWHGSRPRSLSVGYGTDSSSDYWKSRTIGARLEVSPVSFRIGKGLGLCWRMWCSRESTLVSSGGRSFDGVIG